MLDCPALKGREKPEALACPRSTDKFVQAATSLSYPAQMRARRCAVHPRQCLVRSNKALVMGGIVREYAEQNNACHGKQYDTVKPTEMLDKHHRVLLRTMTHLH
jgi:hypothetical protein